MKQAREAAIAAKFAALQGEFNERHVRLWAGAEADAIGYGGVAAVARATGLAISTVRLGRDEVRAGVPRDRLVRVRRAGAGRPTLETLHPELPQILESLVDPLTRGDPESPLRWTLKSTRVLAKELLARGYRVSAQKVSEMLHALGYSLQSAFKTVEGKQHPDRNAQFEHINARAMEFQARGIPVVSVDTKKKELVGDFKNAGREWQPQGEPERVLVHDFPDDALGKAIPYGIYDIADNSAWVSVGNDHDTPTFAVKSLETWFEHMGAKRYPDARELFVTADAGGSNGHRSRVWKAQLQRLADVTGLAIHVSHFPPGTSKWNKIEHRLFSFITLNWRGRPLETFETVVKLIGATTTRAGLVVKAKLDKRKYPIGVKVSKREMESINIERAAFQGDWNYTIRPRPASAKSVE